MDLIKFLRTIRLLSKNLLFPKFIIRDQDCNTYTYYIHKSQNEKGNTIIVIDITKK